MNSLRHGLLVLCVLMPMIMTAAAEAADTITRGGSCMIPGMQDTAEARFDDRNWKKILTDEQFAVTRRGATERPFTGRYYAHKERGTYRCVCCGRDLFSSAAKYESGSGWPSYWQPADSAAVREISDTTHGMVRTEIRCSRCDAHLGHVFDDGPRPTGLRYCVNSASLHFVPATSGTDRPQSDPTPPSPDGRARPPLSP